MRKGIRIANLVKENRGRDSGDNNEAKVVVLDGCDQDTDIVSESVDEIGRMRSSRKDIFAAASLSEGEKSSLNTLINLPLTDSIAEYSGTDLLVCDAVDVINGAMLTDAIVNSAIRVITKSVKDESVIILTTYFYAILSGGAASRAADHLKKYGNIFEGKHHLVLIPIHLREVTHWVTAAIDLRERVISYYDSLGNVNRRHIATVCNNLEICFDFIRGELTKPQQQQPWKWKRESPPCPQQLNGTDCGVFVIKTIEKLARKSKAIFSNQRMSNVRKRIVLEIAKNSNLPTTAIKQEESI